MNTKRSLKMTVGLAATMVAFGLTFKAAAGGVKNVTTNTTYALEESVFNPATGETVNFSGDVHIIAHTRFLADGTVKVSIQCNMMDAGIGEKTGDSYKFRIHDTHAFTFNATGFPFTVTIQCNMRLLNKGSCNDVEVPLMVQFTVQKDGSVSAKYVEDGGGDITP
jgi:hypothetical protein